MEHSHELILTLGRVEGKTDAIMEAVERLEAKLEKHDGRLGTLERWQAKVLGMGAVAGAIVSGAWQYISSGHS